MIGTVLDKYEILQKVGEGGMATVYRGRHTTLGRDVAIKVLHPHLSAAERNRQRFAREARAIEHLDHDNILKIFDYSGNLTDDCYIVTEFVDGVTLQRMVSERGRVPSEVAAIIGLRLAEALSYAHELGIIHRDLKPENVMLRRDGAVKLMDFGIARFLDEMNLTVTGALVGSPAYMSPEQAMERVLDPRSDLFSMGTLLFHLVTGQLPFSGSNPSIILRNIIEGNRPEVLELAPDISGDLADLIEALLQTDLLDRPSAATEVEDRLRAALDNIQLDWRHPSWSVQAWLADPKGYEERLDTHLRTILLIEGRLRLEQRDHLGALRLFNRLLSIDEDNDEVLTLVQSMHVAPPGASRRRTWVGGASLALVLVVSLATLALWPADPTDPAGTEPATTGTSTEGPPPSPATSTAARPATSTTSPEQGVPAAIAAVAPEPSTATTAKGSKVRAPIPPGPTEERAQPPPAPDEDDAGSAAEEPDPPGLLTVVVPGSWAQIYIDDALVGKTGVVTAIPVTPGTHDLRLENPSALPHSQAFTVASGEELTLDVPLQRPPQVLIDSAIDAACEVALDGSPKGTVRSLGRSLRMGDSEGGHVLQITCPDGTQVHELPAIPPGSSVTVGEP